MFSKFFIKRPVFATVVAIIIVIAGLMSLRVLPVEEYPEVTPPQVSVTATYVGADAETIAKTVASQLEQQINGVEDMIYMISTSSSSGSLSLNVYFEIGTDIDQATINVNNRVQMALASLPSEVQTQGVVVQKKSSTILKVVALSSPDGAYDQITLANYALINVIDDLKRLNGVGDASLFGTQNYSMRIWLKPDSLLEYNLATSDILSAIKDQNNQFPAGAFNQSPESGKESFTYTIGTDGRFTTPEEFGEIIIRSNSDGSSLKLKDVSRIELGAQSYNVTSSLNNKSFVPFGIYLQSGANALETSKLVDETLKSLSADFPAGVEYVIPYDTTTFVQISIQEVFSTFIEAILLVVLIVYLFLGNMRATIIPILAIPVSIIGSFAGMYLLGFSVNLLTLFGLILAIGIVVDDAIIVIENVERILHEDRTISVRDATIKAMDEIIGPVVAVVLVLISVFGPVAFLGGFTGQMYQQFAVTIVVAVILSGIVALTLTPALCAIFLKKKEVEPFWFVQKFNHFFDHSTNAFVGGVGYILKHSIIAVAIIGVMVASAWHLFEKVPTGLVPMEDKGALLAVTSLPPAATLSRTQEVMNEISEIGTQNPNIKYFMSIRGFDLLSGAPKTNAGSSFITLHPWSERPLKSQSADAIAMDLNIAYSQIPEATTYVLNMPPIMGLSLTGGFEMYIQDRSGGTLQELSDVAWKVSMAANARPELKQVRTTFDISVPRYKVVVDREKAKMLGVDIATIFSTLQTTFGSTYVNDINLYGRTYQVNVQSEAGFRESPRDLSQVFVRSSDNSLIPLDVLVSYNRETGPDIIERYNAFSSAKVMGEPNAGYTSGDALNAITEVAREVLPEGYTIGWVGSSYQEKEMAGSGMMAFMFGGIFIFLILAAQYERWLMPLAIVMSVPSAVLGAITAVYLRGLTNDIYFQIGLLVLMGLAAKNAVLIVEFAMMAQEKGKSIYDSAVEAARLRFRPIVMTSLAFTIGVVPLAISTGAGAASRHAIGTGVIGGMLFATTIGIFFIPVDRKSVV